MLQLRIRWRGGKLPNNCELKDHMAPAVAFASRGYHVLVEKPMAVTEDDCRYAFCVQRSLIIEKCTLNVDVMNRKITSACEEAGVMLVVCHVLRYN